MLPFSGYTVQYSSSLIQKIQFSICSIKLKHFIHQFHSGQTRNTCMDREYIKDATKSSLCMNSKRSFTVRLVIDARQDWENCELLALPYSRRLQNFITLHLYCLCLGIENGIENYMSYRNFSSCFLPQWHSCYRITFNELFFAHNDVIGSAHQHHVATCVLLSNLLSEMMHKKWQQVLLDHK